MKKAINKQNLTALIQKYLLKYAKPNPQYDGFTAWSIAEMIAGEIVERTQR